jgi:hypothetical protein
MKDVVMLGGYQEAEIHFIADNPGADAFPLSSATPHGLRLYDVVRLQVNNPAILDGVVVGSLALMAVVAWQLGRVAIVDCRAVIILIASVSLVLKFRVNSAWVIAGAALSGWVLH